MTSSPVTVFTTSGPVMNMCELSRTMKMKSVIAGEYTAPPAHGPRITRSGARRPTTARCGRRSRRSWRGDTTPFLDAGAGAVVEADDRGADLQGEVHQLVDLLGEHLAERAAEDGEVLAEDEHLATVDRAPARDHAVGVRPLLEAGGVGAVAGEQVELLERVRDRAGSRCARGRAACPWRAGARPPAATRRGRPAPSGAGGRRAGPASGSRSRAPTLVPPGQEPPKLLRPQPVGDLHARP